MTDDELTIVKGMIYGSKRIPIGYLQRKYRIGYNAAYRLITPLVEEGLISPILANQPCVFNWEHQGWQEIAKQRHLWQPWALCAAEPKFFCDEEIEEDKCWAMEQYDGRFAEYLAVFDTFTEALEWMLYEYVEMRDLLLQKTREFLQGKGEFVPMQEQIAFKHSREMQFATMTMADYLTEKCRLTDRKTGQVYEFDDIEDLLIAGWRLD